MQGIEIPIGAPLGTLTKDLKGAESQLKNFESRANSTLNKAGTAATKSTKDFTGLSRVIQDLPFGFIGIQNNLTQLLPAAGALGLGISVLVAAVTFAQTGFANWTRGLKDTKKAVDDAKMSGDEYINTLNQVAQGSLKGQQSAQSEITTLQLLYKQYTNNNNTLESRKSAYKQLQDLYPGYFGNLEFEATATGVTEEAYKKLTASILASAKARAYADEISKNSIRALENTNKVTDLEKSQKDYIDNAVKSAEKGAMALNATYTEKQKDFKLTQEQIDKLKVQAEVQARGSSIYIKNQQAVNNLKTDTNKLTQKSILLEQEVNKELAKGGLLSGGTGGKGGGQTKNGTRESRLQYFDENLGLKRLLARTKKTLPSNKPLIPIESLLGDIISPKTGELIYGPFAELKDTINFDLLPQLSTSFQGFFDDILMHGKLSFKSLGDSIKNTFASVLASEVTQKLLGLLGGVNKDGSKMGSGGILDSLLKSGGVGKALGTILPVAGIALAAGSILGGIFKKKTAPTPVQSNVATTATSGGYNDFGGGTVVFRIQGTDLIGVLNRAGAKLQRFGP